MILVGKKQKQQLNKKYVSILLILLFRTFYFYYLVYVTFIIRNTFQLNFNEIMHTLLKYQLNTI
jgi:hypothetical protein